MCGLEKVGGGGNDNYRVKSAAQQGKICQGKLVGRLRVVLLDMTMPVMSGGGIPPGSSRRCASDRMQGA